MPIQPDSMPRRVCIFLVGLGLLAVSTVAQDQPALPQSVPDVLVRLGEPTILDDMGAQIEGLERFPEEALRLPDVDTTGALFLSVFYTHSATDGAFALRQRRKWLPIRLQQKIAHPGKQQI